MTKLKVRILDYEVNEQDREKIIDLLDIRWIDDPNEWMVFEDLFGPHNYEYLVLSDECIQDMASMKAGLSIPRTEDATADEIAGWHHTMKLLENFNYDESRKKFQFEEYDWKTNSYVTVDPFEFARRAYNGWTDF